MNRPQAHEYPAWAETYIKLVEGDVLFLLERQAAEFPDFVSSLVEKADHAYAPGKWTIKEMIGHIIDTERVFSYRITCFARGEQQPLPGFDEAEYAASAHFSDRSLLSLAHEFSLLRRSNLYLYRSLTEAELDRKGNASGREITVRAILYMTAGHLIHHTQIIKERYL